MGETVMSTALFMGVERDRPLKNMSILMTIPKMAQLKIRNQSFFSIRSLGAQKLISQNKIAAPETRSRINP